MRWTPKAPNGVDCRRLWAALACVLFVVCGAPAQTSDFPDAPMPWPAVQASHSRTLVAGATDDGMVPLPVIESTPVISQRESPQIALTGGELPVATWDTPEAQGVDGTPAGESIDVSAFQQWASPDQLPATIKTVTLLSIVSLAPAFLLMTTSFVRVSVVLGLLRQAIGPQVLPSNQIVTSLALFMTLIIMGPTWKAVYDEAVVPYTDEAAPISAEEAWQRGVKPVRDFMSRQIVQADNVEDVYLFCDYLPGHETPSTFDEVPLQALLPAFMLSELKTAFLIGFRIFLPFLILDLVVSSVTVSLGMMMLPPVAVSLPFKLLLFVMVDGWHLVVEMLLLQSFGT